jgi:hypothetical protein
LVPFKNSLDESAQKSNQMGETTAQSRFMSNANRLGGSRSNQSLSFDASIMFQSQMKLKSKMRASIPTSLVKAEAIPTIEPEP